MKPIEAAKRHWNALGTLAREHILQSSCTDFSSEDVNNLAKNPFKNLPKEVRKRICAWLIGT